MRSFGNEEREMAETLSCHDHGNCELCDEQQAQIADLQAALQQAQEERDRLQRWAIAWGWMWSKAAIKRDAAIERGEELWHLVYLYYRAMQDSSRAHELAFARAESAERELAEQRALAERLGELREDELACGCATKEGGIIYTTVCARHRGQGYGVGRRLGEAPAEAQEEGD